MENRVAQMKFPRLFLLEHKGLSAKMLIEVFKKLPEDTFIIGLGEDVLDQSCRFLLHSGQFELVEEGFLLPEIIPTFIKHKDNTVTVERVEYIANQKARRCSHVWTEYKGISESYQYCNVCGKREDSQAD